MGQGLVEMRAGEGDDLGAATDDPLLALGSAHVHFHRPERRDDGRTERPSLFNPYWEARLSPRPAGGLRAIAAVTQ